jgi:hypothetical protein
MHPFERAPAHHGREGGPTLSAEEHHLGADRPLAGCLLARLSAVPPSSSTCSTIIPLGRLPGREQPEDYAGEARCGARTGGSQCETEQDGKVDWARRGSQWADTSGWHCLPPRILEGYLVQRDSRLDLASRHGGSTYMCSSTGVICTALQLPTRTKWPVSRRQAATSSMPAP